MKWTPGVQKAAEDLALMIEQQRSGPLGSQSRSHKKVLLKLSGRVEYSIIQVK